MVLVFKRHTAEKGDFDGEKSSAKLRKVRFKKLLDSDETGIYFEA